MVGAEVSRRRQTRTIEEASALTSFLRAAVVLGELFQGRPLRELLARLTTD
jgi:hypothetical protein